MELSWTSNQQSAIDQLQEWISEEPVRQADHFKCLEGPAGSGKSTLVKAVIANIPKSQLMGAAPTHTAKDILIEFAGIDAGTIHQVLGLKPDISLEFYNPASPTYAQLNPDLFENGGIRLFIIDESSMLNAPIVTMLKERALATNKKILFIGDRLQLPPIGETLSTAFTTVDVISLTDVMRQSGSNPVNEMIAIAREDAQMGTDHFDAYLHDIRANLPTHIVTNDVGVEEGYVVNDGTESVKDKLYTLFSNSMALHDYKFAKIVAFTNSKVKAYNKRIKGIVNPSELPVSTGDWLLGYAPFKQKKIVLSQNGVYYKVKSATLAFHTYNGINYQIIKVVLTYTIRDRSGNIREIDRSMKLLHPESYQDFYTELTAVWTAGVGPYRRWGGYYKLLENFALIDDFDITTEEANGKMKKHSMAKKNFDLGYAITVHKSQGCTFQNVYIDYESFATCYESSTRRSLVYVAVSRVKHINMIYG